MIRKDLKKAIAERVSWREHHHTPRTCCLDAILDAIPSGWMKTDDGWIKFDQAASCENYCGFCLVHDEPWPCAAVRLANDVH